MITGYNHNVKYKEQMFHIQTEDSGLENPHIITHLFVGGNIVKTRKVGYAAALDKPNRDDLIVQAMQTQHKGMLRDLIKGGFDTDIEVRSVNAATLNGPAPLNVEAGAQHRSSFGFGGAADAGKAAAKGKPAAPAMPAAAKTTLPPPPAFGAPPPAPKSTVPPPVSTFFGTAPPPPGNEKFIDAATLERVFDSGNESAVDSIFGEDLISEKSLDEVILSYLAEDMQRG